MNIQSNNYSNETAPPEVRVSRPRHVKPTIEERFDAFHEANPHVYQLLVGYARQAKKAGRTRLGIAALFERARWYSAVETSDGHFKLNNDYKAPYARLIEANEPDLQGFFEMRERRN